jgi:hypothetical protein
LQNFHLKTGSMHAYEGPKPKQQVSNVGSYETRNYLSDTGNYK